MEIPNEVKNIIKSLKEAGFEGYTVGGCTRDLLLGIEPKDWDVTTNARPEEIQKIFPDSVYENDFGTVGVKTESEDEKLKIVEITTYRVEEEYTDKRHPDKVSFTTKLEEDLARRDFTINAIAMDDEGKIVDPFEGQKDIENKVIRAVGDPTQRFNEDALRLMRAIRLAHQLGFDIEDKTYDAIKEKAPLLKAISKERVRDEFVKIISHTPLSWLEAKEKRGDQKSNELTKEEYESGPVKAFDMLRETGLLKIFLPELEEGYEIGQNKHHIYSVWEHNLRALTYATKENFGLDTRLAALLHDIGKPETKRGEGEDSTFYGHEVVGAKMAAQVMDRLKFPKRQTEKVTLLVRYHLFLSDPDKITDSAVRRVVRNVGENNIWDLIDLRLCDRIGSGVAKAEPYRLRKYLVMLEKALREPVSLKQLNTNGDEIMQELGIEPGKKIGLILNTLMNDVLDNPEHNNKEYLFQKSKELNELSEEELEKTAKEAIKKMEKIEMKKEEETKEKYWVD
jgi:poly(A) polymerase/tRNA nucleotidyltransferase (CCA-adding enzyme)